MSRFTTVCALALVTSLWPAPLPAQEHRCASAEYRQFDFWIGSWDVFERGSTQKSADVVVAADLEGCVIAEDYQDPSGLRGRSVSSYDSRTRTWQQTWMTNRGQLLVIHGKRRGNVMAFEGWLHDGDAESLVRATWAPEANGVRETAQRSADGGKTWTTWFDLSFRPRARPQKP
jgi:hypothetical protein